MFLLPLQPVKLLACKEDVRAWPGGVGNAKVGGNYAPTIKVRIREGAAPVQLGVS